MRRAVGHLRDRRERPDAVAEIDLQRAARIGAEHRDCRRLADGNRVRRDDQARQPRRPGIDDVHDGARPLRGAAVIDGRRHDRVRADADAVPRVGIGRRVVDGEQHPISPKRDVPDISVGVGGVGLHLDAGRSDRGVVVGRRCERQRRPPVDIQPCARVADAVAWPIAVTSFPSTGRPDMGLADGKSGRG